MLLRIIARSLKFLFWIIVFRFIFTKILTWQTQIDQPRLEERLREEVKMERPYGFVFPIVAVIPQGDAYEEIIILQHDYTKIRYKDINWQKLFDTLVKDEKPHKYIMSKLGPNVLERIKTHRNLPPSKEKDVVFLNYPIEDILNSFINNGNSYHDNPHIINLSNSEEAKKLFDELVNEGILNGDGVLLKNVEGLSYFQQEEIKWFNMAILKEIMYPDVVNKSIQGELYDFMSRHKDYSFLIPQGWEKTFRKQLSEYRRIYNGQTYIYGVTLEIKPLKNDRQFLKVSIDRGERTDVVWYEATDKEIFPKYFLHYSGPPSFGVLLKAFIYTIITWGTIFLLFTKGNERLKKKI